MNSISFSLPLFSLVLPFLLLFLVKSAVVSAYPDEWFFDCKEPTRCEDIGRMEFPLWRNNNETQICGYSESMVVNCKGSDTTIEILGAQYRLLGFDNKDQILIIAKLEILIPDAFCSKDRKILSRSIYAMIPVNKCRDNTQHSAKPARSDTEFRYIPFENRTPYSPRDDCRLSVIVPISASLLTKLDADLGKVAKNITEEFKSERKVDVKAQLRESCSVVNGVYGYDLEYNQTRCYCQSSSHGFEPCPPPPPEKEGKAGANQVEQCCSNPSLSNFNCYCSDSAFKKGKSKRPFIIGVSIGGACLVATILGCCICYCLKRKKKHPITSRKGPSPLVSNSLSNNDMAPPTLLSNSFQTHSIPFYPSSKSDLASNHGTIRVFNYADLEKATGNFSRSRELGDGGFGMVYYGMLQDGREVAVKRLYEHNCKRVEQYRNEIDILAHLQHKNLVKLYGCTSEYSRGLLLVYEFIPNGTVADHLHGSRAKFGLLSWPIRLRIAIETANALVYLHRSEIIHRDVKTNNILLDNNFTVKVADFGLSRLFSNDVTHVSTAPQGTPGYVDPEYYQCYQLTTKSDVYSFGVVLIELISSLKAVDMDRKRQDINLSNMALSKIQTQALNELIDPKLDFEKNHVVMRAITSVAELAFRCLQQEKDMRPPMEEVVEELRDIENDKFSFELTKVVDIGVVGDTAKKRLPAFSPNSSHS